MQSPVKGKVAMGLDPGYRNGCKVAIVLVLAHADGLGVDLHQLGQGVLEPSQAAFEGAQAGAQGL